MQTTLAPRRKVRRQQTCWLLGILLASCGTPRTSSRPTALTGPRDHFDSSAVEIFWRIQDKLEAGATVDAADWDDLFATPAYRWLASDDNTRRRIRATIEVALDQDPERATDAARDAKGADATRWRHYARIRAQRQDLEKHLKQLQASTVLLDARRLARTYLPQRAVDAHSGSTPIRMLFFWPDFFAGHGAIFMDLLKAKDMGEDLVRLLAHEFHHEYYVAMSEFPELHATDRRYSIVQAVRQLHLEGLADRIDKGSYPIQEPRGGLPGYAQAYNQHYEDAPATLAKLDATLLAMAAGGDVTKLGREAWKLLHYAGHCEGFYIANTIAAAQGPEALLEDVGNPFAFLRRFQKVQPTFSAESMRFLEQLEAQVRRAQ